MNKDLSIIARTSLFTFSETESSTVSIKYKGLGDGEYVSTTVVYACKCVIFISILR